MRRRETLPARWSLPYCHHSIQGCAQHWIAEWPIFKVKVMGIHKGSLHANDYGLHRLRTVLSSDTLSSNGRGHDTLRKDAVHEHDDVVWVLSMLMESVFSTADPVDDTIIKHQAKVPK